MGNGYNQFGFAAVFHFCVICTVIVCMPGMSHAMTKEEARNWYLNNIPKQPFPDNIKSFAISLIKNDNIPIHEQRVVRLAKQNHLTRQESLRLMAYIDAWMLRNHKKPKKILRFYKQLPFDHSPSLIGRLHVTYPQVLDSSYSNLATLHFANTIQRMNEDMNTKYLTRAREAVLFAADFLIRVQGDQAISLIGRHLKHNIADADMRFNLVSRTISNLGAQGMDIGKWYFHNYAFRRFEVSTLRQYFRKYLSDTEVKSLMSKKVQELRKTLTGLSQAGFSSNAEQGRNKLRNPRPEATAGPER